jgi:hypothetical protein
MQTLLSGWNIIRVLRLAIGIMAMIQAYQQSSWILAVAGFFVIIPALANLGCCGTTGCTVDNNHIKDRNKMK